MKNEWTDSEVQEMLAEIDAASIISPITSLNFSFAGSRLDVNKLIRNGWTDLTSFCDEGEFIRQGSTWIELVAEIDNLEYHASMALSSTLMKPSESVGVWKIAYGCDAVAAHEMRTERYAFFRQLCVHVLDAENTKYENLHGNCPQEFVEKIKVDILEAVEFPSKLLVPDILYQTDNYEPYDGLTGLNDAENKLLILKGVLERAKSNGDKASIVRLLTPIVRAVLTNDDPEGREFIFQVSHPKVLHLILESAYYANATEVMVALFKLFLKAYSKSDLSTLPFGLWGMFSYALLSHDLTKCAKYALENAIVTRSPEDLSETEIMVQISARLLLLVKRHISNSRKLKDLLTFANKLAGHFCDDVAIQALGPLIDCHAAELDGGNPTDHLDGLKSLFEKMRSRFDEAHKDDEQPWAKTLCPAIKAPLVWQDLVFAAYGFSDVAIEALPDCPFHSTVYLKRRPPCTVVEGLSAYDVWAGFLPGNPNDDDYKELISRLYSPLNKVVASERVHVCEYNGTPHSEVMEIVEESDFSSELSAIAVREQDSGEKKGTVLGIFPFLPHELSNAEDVTVGAVWEYYPWERNEAADARIRLESGDCIYATLPFYAADKWLMPRGFRMKVRLAGFAHSLKKYSHEIDMPKSFIVDKGPLAEDAGHPVEVHMDSAALDWFEQDIFPEYISRSGFSLCGRIKSIRTIDALGTQVFSVKIDCRKLEIPFEIFVPKEKVIGELNIGDLVESSGWVYADFKDQVDSLDDYNTENPKIPPQETGREKRDFGAGFPTFIRTEFTEEEKKWMPSDILHPDWMGYAENKLRSLNGVTWVARCGQNPQSYNFLVRQKDVLRKFAFIIEDGESVTKNPFVGVELLTLRRIKQGNGLKLEWEIKERNKGV
jgi:hypothetical protein